MFSSGVVLFCFSLLFHCNGEAPCSPSELDQLCQSTADCSGQGAVCVDGSCECHPNFIQIPPRGLIPSHCEKAPSDVGSICTPPYSYCKPPLVCLSNNQCGCSMASTTDKGPCLSKIGLGDSCSTNGDCSEPFTYCVAKKCVCVPGSYQTKSGKCAGDPKCPDGSAPFTNQTCISLVPINSEVFDNIHNSAAATDTCNSRSYCVTDGSDYSPLGFCCAIPSCPLGYQPDTDYSCSPNAKANCPLDTHYCHRLIGPTFSVSLCCRSPCPDVTPVYVGGKCYPQVSLNGSCLVDEQCDGGVSMQCWNAACWCRTGYKTNTKEPDAYQTCVKNCGDLALEDRCLSAKVAVSGSCSTTEQCADGNSYCYAGVCRCRCGFMLARGACLDPSNTTITPANPISSALSTLLDALKKFGFIG